LKVKLGYAQGDVEQASVSDDDAVMKE